MGLSSLPRSLTGQPVFKTMKNMMDAKVGKRSNAKAIVGVGWYNMLRRKHGREQILAMTVGQLVELKAKLDADLKACGIDADAHDGDVQRAISEAGNAIKAKVVKKKRRRRRNAKVRHVESDRRIWFLGKDGQPRSLFYVRYIKSPEWKAVRARVISERGSTCSGCMRKFPPYQLQCHHLTYERLGRELDSDLELLCVDCHERHHGRQFTSGN